MTITTFAVGAAVTPTVVKTYVSHYANRKPRHQKPTAHISYDEGLQLVRSFLDYASHKTVEDLQAFTAQWVPHPSWVKTENITIPEEHLSKAATTIIEQLGPNGLTQVGGGKWWQWRRRGGELKAEWIEMKGDHNDWKRKKEKCRRIMLYVHGGAYFFGSVDEHRYQLQRHARKLKARVLAPRYRLAPQFPFPCGLQDCLATYMYLLTCQDPTEIILAGDSAGGGMVMSMLCILRDQNIALPAGAILISPWVDLTHSFPSVAGGNDFDYIPAHGFMQKPSPSWPPPNDDEMEAIMKGAGKTSGSPNNSKQVEMADSPATEQTAVQGFTEYNINNKLSTESENGERQQSGMKNELHIQNPAPSTKEQLSIEINGKLVVIKDQIQMYAPNHLLSHPLVSPVLQPSLGGLPPLLILTGGGEVLRDEQIYLAHKAAHPTKYSLGALYKLRHDPNDVILNKYKPTHVQLQVWDDLCHVAPTLSFTRPAKYMYRSIAQFGAWALARAQKRSIEIMDDDNISVISSGSESGSESGNEKEPMNKQYRDLDNSDQALGYVGRAGDPLPAFKNFMIRQRVDRHGTIYPLATASELPALQMDPDLVGTIKIGPVKKWMDAKMTWDTKYASVKRKVQKQRIKDLVSGGSVTFGDGESPPPSALAGRRKEKDLVQQRNKKSYGLAMWSMFSSKHDEHVLKREEEYGGDYTENGTGNSAASNGTAIAVVDEAGEERSIPSSRNRRSSGSRNRRNLRQTSRDGDRSRSRRRTVTVTDEGQTEGVAAAREIVSSKSTNDQPVSPTSQRETSNNLLSPGFIPKFKTAAHLQPGGRDQSDASSVRTGYSQLSPDNASTRAVIAAPGIVAMTTVDDQDRPTTADTTTSDVMSDNDAASTVRPGYDTPVSRRSVERLQGNQLDPTDPSLRLQPMRTPSTVAVVAVEGVIEPVDSAQVEETSNDSHVNSKTKSEANEANGASTPKQDEADAMVERPAMYDRTDSEFQTAVERL